MTNEILGDVIAKSELIGKNNEKIYLTKEGKILFVLIPDKKDDNNIWIGISEKKLEEHSSEIEKCAFAIDCNDKFFIIPLNYFGEKIKNLPKNNSGIIQIHVWKDEKNLYRIINKLKGIDIDITEYLSNTHFLSDQKVDFLHQSLNKIDILDKIEYLIKEYKNNSSKIDNDLQSLNKEEEILYEKIKNNNESLVLLNGKFVNITKDIKELNFNNIAEFENIFNEYKNLVSTKENISKEKEILDNKMANINDQKMELKNDLKNKIGLSINEI